MRVCIVSQEYPPETGGGGIGTQSFLKAHGLAARGHHVEVLSASWKNPRIEKTGDVLVHRILPSDLGVEQFDMSTQWLAYSWAVAGKLREMDAENNFDIIQFPEYGAEGFVHQTSRFTFRKARYCLQLHGPLAMFVEHMGWPDKQSTFAQVGCMMEKLACHHADGILASSHNTADFCAQHYDFPRQRVNVIHSGIDTARFIPQPHKNEDAFPRILFVGNLAGNKGFNLLVDTVVGMKQKYPKIMLRTIGRGDEEVVSAARKRVAAAGAEGNVEFLRYVPYLELPQHYAWCDLFAGPSIYEPGPGNVYLEAMSCARPVIACNTAGAPEVVLEGKTGLLIPPQDTAALQQAISTLADSPALRRSLGEAGRQSVEENFAIEKYIDKVEGFYQHLLNLPAL